MLNLDASQIIIQIIAFLVMLWVMKRYGWQPLLNVLEARRKKIQTEFDTIARQQEEVHQLTLQYETKLKEIDAAARKKIQEAVMEGHRINSEMQKNAEIQAKEILERTKSEMKQEIVKAKNQLKSDMVNSILYITEKILQEKLDVTAQKKLIINFMEEMPLK